MNARTELLLNAGFMFPAGEFQAFLQMPRSDQEHVVAARKAVIDGQIALAKSNVIFNNNGHDGKTVTTVRKPGDPDWHEVQVDAEVAVAKKIFGQEPV